MGLKLGKYRFTWMEEEGKGGVHISEKSPSNISPSNSEVMLKEA